MSFFEELNRRNVFRVGIAYLAAVWVIIQVADTILPVLGAPPWILQALVFSSALGFPVALVLAWTYELTPEGIKATGDRQPSAPAKFKTRRLDYAIIALLVLALGFVVADNYFPFEPSERTRFIAALPFDNESSESENAAFFANGIHDELLTQLAKIGSLSVISRTSVEEYRGSSKNIRQIGRELGVAALLEGRVQRAGNRVRINVQLIDAERDAPLWAETYERELSAQNIFEIQRDTATAIARALRATLAPEEVTRLNDVPTGNLRAYDFYLRGRDFLSRNEGQRYAPQAVDQFRQAVREDPDFGRAWAGLSRAHSMMYLYNLDRTTTRLASAREAVERALELSPDDPENHLAMAYYYWFGAGDVTAALGEVAIAEESMPSAAEIYEIRSYIQRRAGEWASATANMAHAIELDPRNVDLLFRQGGNYMHVRNFTRQQQIHDRILAIEPDNEYARFWDALLPLQWKGDFTRAKATATSPEGVWQRSFLGWLAAIYERDYELAISYLNGMDGDWHNWQLVDTPVASYYGVTYVLAGRPELAAPYFQIARTLLEEALATSPDNAGYHVGMGELLASLGERDAAIRHAIQALALIPKSVDALDGQLIQQHVIVRVIAPAGDVDLAIEQLDDYLGAPGDWSIMGLEPDPRLDQIRNDSRLDVLLEEYGLN